MFVVQRNSNIVSVQVWHIKTDKAETPIQLMTLLLNFGSLMNK